MTKFLPLLLALFLTLGSKAQTDLIISEYVEGWSTNKALEIFNPTSEPINLKDYQIVRYANGEDVPPAADDWKVALPDVTLEPYKTFVCVIDKRDPNGTGQEAPIWKQLEVRADVFLCPNYAISNTLYHNGDDALALEKSNGTLVDLFARWGDPRPASTQIGGSELSARCWTDTPPYFTGAGVGITADHTLIRKSDVVNGVTVNPAMFNPLEQWDSLPANTFDHLGWHKSNVSPSNSTPSFPQEMYEFKMSKTSAEGAVLGKVEASDAENNTLKYFINSGNFIYNDNGTPDDFGDDIRLTPFTINKETGEITLSDASSLQYSKNDSVYINISVNDGYSESEWITVLALLSNFPVKYDAMEISSFDVFPNPISENKVLTVVSDKKMEKVVINNISGQVVQQIQVNANKSEIDLKGQKNGIYFIEAIFDDNSSAVKRVVKN